MKTKISDITGINLLEVRAGQELIIVSPKDSSGSRNYLRQRDGVSDKVDHGQILGIYYLSNNSRQMI